MRRSKQTSLTPDDIQTYRRLLQTALRGEDSYYQRLQDHQLLLPDEIFLVFGTQDFARLEDDHAKGHDAHRGVNFSRGFAKKMERLTTLTQQDPRTRLMATGTWALGIFHEGYRHYGLAVKRDNLLSVVGKIRDNKELYWLTPAEESEAQTNAYRLNEDTGMWEGVQGGFDGSIALPDMHAVPPELLTYEDLYRRSHPGDHKTYSKRSQHAANIENLWNKKLENLIGNEAAYV